MGLRVCLVTPFAWSRPHDVNEHVDGLARELRALGHDVTVLAPSTRAADLVAGRRALLDGVAADVIALGPALPVSRRSRIGVPVGVRANLALALQRGRFDIVHGFEPGLPSLSYLALRDSHALGVATFLSAERSATRRASLSASASSRVSMHCLRPRPRSPPPRPCGSPATTGSSSRASTPSSSGPRRR